MKWKNREIQLMRHRYNCQINDPAYPPVGGRIGKWLLDWHHRRHGVPTEGMRSSERAIEIPLAIDFLAHEINGDDVLELGCVLPYYILKDPRHRVYDLMDPHPENEKRDIRTLSDAELKTNIVSVSTLEHLGMDEYGVKAGDKRAAIEVLERILAHARKCFVTIPLGHNPALDEYLLNADDLLRGTYVARIPECPEQWRVIPVEDLTEREMKENTYCRANAICVIEKTAL